MGQGDDREAALSLIGSERGENVSLAEWDRLAPLPLADASVDFIYSLQGVKRLGSLAEFKSLVDECARVLRPGGVAMLWFGRLSRFPFAPPGKAWLRGYDVRVDSATSVQKLHLRMFHACRAVLSAGMKAPSLSTPLHPDTSWRLFRGGEDSYITAWKPG